MRRLLFCMLFAVLLTACQQSGPVDLKALAGKARAGDAVASRELVDLLAMEKNNVSEKVYPLVIEIGQPMVAPLLTQIHTDNREQRD